ncbi:MAG TPA: hypothetical protein VGB49_00230, partial [Caulobacteraceae bacterium]
MAPGINRGIQMKTKVVAAVALSLCVAAPAAAQDGGQIVRVGDTAMTCQQITASAEELTPVLGETPGLGREQVISAATSAAMQGA